MTLFIIVLAAALLLGVPIALSLGVASVPMMAQLHIAVSMISSRVWNGVSSFTLIAIPFFILAGNIMGDGGVSKRIIRVADSLMGKKEGGLASIAIASSMFFAAISGSGPATTAAIGGTMIPAMRKKGYSGGFSVATQISAATIGVIIPPSIPMVLYCMGTSVSIAELFAAGIVPGIFIGMIFIFYAKIISKKRGYKGEDVTYTMKQRLHILWEGLLALITPIIILGGVYGGFFTPTEAAIVASIYGLLVSIFVFREMNFKSMIRCFYNTLITMAGLMLIIAVAGLFAYVVTMLNVTEALKLFFLGLGGNKIVFLLVVTVAMFIAGMFFDGGPIMIIFAPILAPVAAALGINLVHFGVVMVVNAALGQITPPYGVCLFVGIQISGVKLKEIMGEVLPYMGLYVVCNLAITFIPAISTFLPELLLG
jgi:C4-dicarboxylate transporter DctM subunit